MLNTEGVSRRLRSDVYNESIDTRETPKPILDLQNAVKDSSQRMARLGFKGGFIMFVALIFSFLFYYNLIKYILITNHSSDVYFLRMDECPACFGESFCPYFMSGDIQFTGAYHYPIVHKLNPRKVFEGKRGLFKSKPILIKQLFDHKDLSPLSKRLCLLLDHPQEHCLLRAAIRHSVTTLERRAFWNKISGIAPMFRCGVRQRLWDKVEQVMLRETDADRLLYNELYMLYFTILVNQEPLLLAAFSSSKGWPFPQYYGPCGYFVVVEHRGDSMDKLIDESFELRLKLSKYLLRLAQTLTSIDYNFALYMDDVTLSNFAVHRNTRTVTLVDLSNITVIDRSNSKLSRQHSVTAECLDDSVKCSTKFEPSELCKYHTSDYNIYSVCRYLLSPDHARPVLSVSQTSTTRRGVLHDLHQHPTAHSSLKSLIDTCVTDSSTNRFTTGNNLIHAIDKLLSVSELQS